MRVVAVHTGKHQGPAHMCVLAYLQVLLLCEVASILQRFSGALRKRSSNTMCSQ